MGNNNSASQDDLSEDLSRSKEKSKQPGRHSFPYKRNPQRRTFPGSAILDSTVMLCGVDTTNNSVDQWCAVTPTNEDEDKKNSSFHFDGDRNSKNPDTKNNSSALFARALVNEVTNNPNTMSPAKMTEREKKLLKAQNAAMKTTKGSSSRAVGAPGGIGKPSLLGSLAHAFGGGSTSSTNIDSRNPDDYDSSVQGTSATDSSANGTNHPNRNPSQIATTLIKKTVEPPNSMSENRAQAVVSHSVEHMVSKHRITVGLSLSRRHSSVGHPDTVTRQTVFDFNELQDREYKFVSSTDATGWRAGGGERGGRTSQANPTEFDEESDYYQQQNSAKKQPQIQQTYKVAAPDTVHIPIIHIDAESPEAIDSIISALARGEVFIPHMAVLPEALSVNGVSPPDLVVRFGCERNEDSPPDEMPNWCLEFMHNQLYEYFYSMGARWMKRPFQITLAKKVRWKTVKHMNRYFAHAERVLDAWREKGPQYLDPQLSYIEGGATPEEVARPHGIYLFRNGVPTNYFAPNFDPPYTTKMTRSLLTNVLDKSWDKKRREWTSEPVPRLVTPSSLVGALCGYSDGTQGGFMAMQVTQQGAVQSTMIDTAALTLEDDSRIEEDPSVISSLLSPKQLEIQSPVPIPKDPPFQLHPKDSSPAQTPGYLAFVSADDVDQNSQHDTLDAKRKSDPNMPSENTVSASPTRNLLSEMKVSSNEQQYRDTVSEVATSSVTVSRGNTTSQVMRRTGAKTSVGTSIEHAPIIREHETEASQEQERTETARGSSLSVTTRKAATYEEKKNESFIPRYTLQTSSTDTQSVPRSDSNISLEYSLDSSLLGGGDSQTTSPYFHNHETAGSIATSNSSRRALVRKKRASRKGLLSKTTEDEPSETEGSLLSNETSATEPPPPTDQELFALGWAKALDPKSGAYYYFTLDRSKIVWDNPLVEPSVFSGSTTSTYQ